MKNARRDRRVLISFEADRSAERGFPEHAVVEHGAARTAEGGAPELLQELGNRYIGPRVAFPPMADPPPGSVVHIAIEKVPGNRPWVGGA